MNTSAQPHAYQLQTFGTRAASLMSCTLQPLNPALLKSLDATSSNRALVLRAGFRVTGSR